MSSSKTRLDEFVGQIDRVLDELSHLSRTTASGDEFFDHVLTRANLILDASYSEIIHAMADGAITRSRSAGKLPDPIHLSGPEFDQTVQSSMLEGRPKLFHYQKGKTQFSAIVCPLSNVIPAAALVSVFPQGLQEGQERTLIPIGTALTEIADDYFASQVVKQRNEIETDYANLTRFSCLVNKDLDVRNTCNRVSNQFRDLFDCYRVSVLRRTGSRFILTSCSGTETINRRANLVRNIERFVQRTGRKLAPGPLIHEVGQSQNVMADELDKFCKQEQIDALLLLPVQHSASETCRFFVVLEFAEKPKDWSTVISKLSFAEQPMRFALNNALQYDSLPFLRPLRALQDSLSAFGTTKRMLYSILSLGAMLLAAFVLFFWQTDLKVNSRGVLAAPSEAYVFAPVDGIVDQVLVEHGQQVAQNEPLIVLRSDSLDLVIATTAGKLEVAKKKLEAQEVAIGTFENSAMETEQANLIRLTGDIIETREQISHLDNESSILESRRNQLVLKSPLAGTVASWDLERILANDRPVNRGDRLVQIVKHGNQWLAWLDIPADQLEYLLDSNHILREGLDVEISVASAPDATFQGTIVEIAKLADENEGNLFSTIKVSVAFETEDIEFENFRPGTTVVASIRCGRVSVAYSLFHRIIRTFRFRFF